MINYDMCVDYDVLCDAEEKLHLIQHNIENISSQMENSINRAQEYLAGVQYEKAKSITEKSIKDTAQIGKNLEYAMKYLLDLMSKIDEYSTCKFEGIE